MFAGSPSRAVLLDAGVRAMQSTPVFDRSGAFLGTLATHYRAPHRFDESERRWLDVLARMAGDTVHRRQSDALSSLATDALEQHVADHTKWLALMHQVTGAVNDSASWYDGLRIAVERICETGHWQAGYVYLPDRADPDTLVPSIGHLRDRQLRPFHLVTQQCRFRRREGLPGTVYDDGRPRWVNGKDEVLRHLPVRARRGRAGESAGGRGAANPVGPDVIAVLRAALDRAARAGRAGLQPHERHRRADRQAARAGAVRRGNGRHWSGASSKDSCTPCTTRWGRH